MGKVQFDEFDVVPDRSRIVRALKGEPTDRVPYFENYIGAKLVEFILG
jgi:hypothetical protein